MVRMVSLFWSKDLARKWTNANWNIDIKGNNQLLLLWSIFKSNWINSSKDNCYYQEYAFHTFYKGLGNLYLNKQSALVGTNVSSLTQFALAKTSSPFFPTLFIPKSLLRYSNSGLWALSNRISLNINIRDLLHYFQLIIYKAYIKLIIIVWAIFLCLNNCIPYPKFYLQLNKN